MPPARTSTPLSVSRGQRVGELARALRGLVVVAGHARDDERAAPVVAAQSGLGLRRRRPVRLDLADVVVAAERLDDRRALGPGRGAVHSLRGAHLEDEVGIAGVEARSEQILRLARRGVRIGKPAGGEVFGHRAAEEGGRHQDQPGDDEDAARCANTEEGEPSRAQELPSAGSEPG